MRDIILQLHKKGGSQTTVQAYKPTEYELELQKIAVEYANAIKDNQFKLNDVGAGLFFDSLADTKVDYGKLLEQAQGQVNSAQQGVADLAQGKLPEEYQKNMEASIQSGVENSVGNVLNTLGSKGVLNSSVTNQSMNDISKNVSNTMAQQYQNNIGILNGLYGQQANMAGQGISLGAAAQEAAANPGKTAWELSLGLNSGGTLGALQSIGGQGTTTTTTSGGGGSGLFGGILTGLAGNSALFCFTEDTEVKTPSGNKMISEIKDGDQVISYNTDTKEDTIESVIDTLVTYGKEKVYTVVCEDDKGNRHRVNTTLTQPLLTDDDIFIDVAMLRIGDQLKNVGTVKEIYYKGTYPVYDLKVTGANTYYADMFIAKGGSYEW